MSNQKQQELAKQTAAALEKRGYTVSSFATKEEARSHILSLIPPHATVGMGGSLTLQQLALTTGLQGSDCEILDHNAPGTTPEAALEIRHRQLSSDVFLTSANAVTQQGSIVNTDGVGNRVAAMLFGPKRVVIVIGTNKIVPDVEAAYDRIKAIAAPLNNKRLNRPNPCVEAGKCLDCQLPTRICNITTVMHRKPSLTDIHVVIISEELGY
ncbi:MAG TPA: lactate utilization protein [Bacillota bacterium]|nr:lactate utilization protein [Bacillota bacterium]